MQAVTMRSARQAFSSHRSCPLRVVCVARPQQLSALPQNQNAVAECRQQMSSSVMLGLASVAAPLLMSVQSAAATGGEYGILEGRTFALIHPIMNAIILLATGYSAYTGWQWRRARELGEEIRSLKAAAPATTGDAPSPANPDIAAKEQVWRQMRGAVYISVWRVWRLTHRANGTGTLQPRSSQPQLLSAEPLPVLAAVPWLAWDACMQERKSLLAGGPRDKHWYLSSFILSAGVGMAIAGAANTYMRTGKLFPGPHLYAGAFIVALWALAASLVPAMQKGDDNARSAHIALNSIQIGLFLWQVPTGWEIVQKVFQFTSWP
ncbi:hypothetical protein QJQ45_020497 [Haematococcus lacustris]|nr:hypothetical protein QJQ45_020497 [Haematococcus lacustris]